jgi:hypothetical protein
MDFQQVDFIRVAWYDVKWQVNKKTCGRRLPRPLTSIVQAVQLVSPLVLQ